MWRWLRLRGSFDPRSSWVKKNSIRPAKNKTVWSSHGALSCLGHLVEKIRARASLPNLTAKQRHPMVFAFDFAGHRFPILVIEIGHHDGVIGPAVVGLTG